MPKRPIDNLTRFKTLFSADPLTDQASSPHLRFIQGVFFPDSEDGTYQIPNLGHHKGMVLSVNFLTDSWATVEGTAVMVAPGIAITAAHVIDDKIDLIMGGKLMLHCSAMTPTGMRYWRVGRFQRMDNSDLMILMLELKSPVPSDGVFHQAHMTTRLPPIGERVLIVGYRAHEPALDQTFPIIDGALVFGIELRSGIGAIVDHFVNGRGAMMPGPTVQVAVSTKGGMSGGAAFDKYGRLFGILSVSNDDPDGLGPSYVSLLWASLAAKLEPLFLPHLFGQAPTLLSLHHTICGIDGRKAVRLARHKGRDALKVDLWSD